MYRNSEGYADPTAGTAFRIVAREQRKDRFLMKNKIVAVDFDGIIVKDKYPAIGPPRYRTINKLKRLSKYNTLILWTCRNGNKLKEAIDFCKKVGLYFNYVNENTRETLRKYGNIDSRKITADIYLDDKGRCKI